MVSGTWWRGWPRRKLESDIKDIVGMSMAGLLRVNYVPSIVDDWQLLFINNEAQDDYGNSSPPTYHEWQNLFRIDCCRKLVNNKIFHTKNYTGQLISLAFQWNSVENPDKASRIQFQLVRRSRSYRNCITATSRVLLWRCLSSSFAYIYQISIQHKAKHQPRTKFKREFA